jgi:uncharacterized protein (DUF433 family)/predicted nuclease of predicted toxin-antitoxin system
MGGKPCIRGMRVTVGTVIGLVAAGRTRDEILREYPYLEAEDIAEALSYAAWRAEEVEVPLRQPWGCSSTWTCRQAGSTGWRVTGSTLVHWSTIGAVTAPDFEILTWAKEHEFVLITNDLDFSAVLAASAGALPSIVQIRSQDLLSDEAVSIVAMALKVHREDIERGALLSINEGGTRVRMLPLKGSQGPS